MTKYTSVTVKTFPDILKLLSSVILPTPEQFKTQKRAQRRVSKFWNVQEFESCPLWSTYLDIDNLIEGQLEQRMCQIRKQDLWVKSYNSNFVLCPLVALDLRPLSLHSLNMLRDCVCASCLLGSESIHIAALASLGLQHSPSPAMLRMVFWAMKGNARLE